MNYQSTRQKNKIVQIKKAFLVALPLLFILTSQLVTAQNDSGIQDKTPEERAQFQTVLMKSKLGLDSQQVIQVQSINLKYALKNDQVFKSDAGKLTRFKQLKASQKEKDGELKKIFSAEQFKQYEAYQAEMKDKMKEKRRQR
jgi:hypothetical protein